MIKKILKIIIPKVLVNFYKNTRQKFSESLSDAQFKICGRGVFWAILTNPFYFARKNLYKNTKYFATQLYGKLLDFGCGSKPYASMFSHCNEYIGCDIEISGHSHTNEKIDVYYDGKTLPFENSTFDSVLTNEVFEHIFNLEQIIIELNRVLKIEGKMLVTVPFVWNEHEVPYDFGRYTSFGITDLLIRNGFEIIELKKTTHYVELLFQMYIEYLRCNFAKLPQKVQSILHFLFITPAVIFGIVASTLLPKNYSLYGDNILLCKKIKNCV